MRPIFIGFLCAAIAAALPAAAFVESVFTVDQPGFGSQRPIVNIVNQPLNLKRAATPEQIGQAIMRAGSRRGWIVTTNRPGDLVGRLHVRQHMAMIDITHDATSFSITYRSSEKLQYDADRKLIHRSYNGWIQNLRNDILNEMAML